MPRQGSASAAVELLENRQLMAIDNPAIDTGLFNNDAFEDIVVVTGRNGTNGQKAQPRLVIMLANSDGTYGDPTNINFSRAGSITAIASGDFNGDGDNDLLIASNGKLDGTTGGQRNKRSRIHILSGNGDGTFAKPTAVQLGGIQEAVYVSTANVDGDGNLDLVVASKNRANFAGPTTNGDGLFVLFGNGDGTFQDAELISQI